MKRDVKLAVGAGLAVAGIGLLFAAIGGQEPPKPSLTPMLGLRGAIPPKPERRMMSYAKPQPPTAEERADRARQVRVLAYRVRQGEITVRSAEIPSDLQADVVELLEQPPVRPSAAAQGALPFDWS